LLTAFYSPLSVLGEQPAASAPELTVPLYLHTNSYGNVFNTTRDWRVQRAVDVTNITKFTLYPPLLGSFTIKGVRFKLWLEASSLGNGKLIGTMYLTINEISLQKESKLMAQSFTVNFENSSISRYEFSVPIQHTFMMGSIIEFQILYRSGEPIPVMLYWDNESTPSQILMTCTDYLRVDWIKTLDVNGTDRSHFEASWTAGKNRVWIQTMVSSPLGGYNIKTPKITIMDPNNLKAVDSEPMLLTSGGLFALSSIYAYIWTYSNASPIGSYSVSVTVSGMADYTLNATGSFSIVSAFVPIPPLYQYVVVAVVLVGAATGGVFIVRRKRYQVPFSFFNTTIKGGVTSPGMVMISGDTGAGKTVLAEHLMYESLNKGRSCVFIVNTEFPSKIKEEMNSFLFDVGKYEEKYIFVDCYSKVAEVESKEKYWVSSLTNLTELGVKMSASLAELGANTDVFFDSLTPLMGRLRPESILSFIHTVGARIKGDGGSFYFIAGAGVDEDVLTKLEETSDCVLELKTFERRGTRRMKLRVKKMRGKEYFGGWIPFSIKHEVGIVFYAQKRLIKKQ